jgi:ketosteroid isomerase-like protein
MTTREIADRLVALCRQGQAEAAQRELYAEDAVNIEPYGTATFPKETRGRDAIIAKGRTFAGLIQEVHAMAFSEPLVAGDAFACALQLDVTVKGHGRMSMDELCIYTVREGKIVSEQFTSRLAV